MTGSGEPRPCKGRWPANVIHDGSDEVMGEFGKAGEKNSPSGMTSRSYGTLKTMGDLNHRPCHDNGQTRESQNGFGDTGSAARFFYCAKASRSERGEGNKHPTVKPLTLIKYLIQLVTPPKGIVLDPFGGSGTTGLAAADLGFNFLVCEREREHIETSERRIAPELAQKKLF